MSIRRFRAKAFIFAVMIDLYLHLTADQKKAKLQQLLCAYETLLAGQSATRIDDSGVGSVYFTAADKPRLEWMIKRLQAELYPEQFARTAVRRPTGIVFTS